MRFVVTSGSSSGFSLLVIVRSSCNSALLLSVIVMCGTGFVHAVGVLGYRMKIFAVN